MSVKIIIDGLEYQYPVPGESPNWGREATEVIVALAETLGKLSVAGDILMAQYPIENNTIANAPIEGMIFDHNSVSGVNISYSIQRENLTEDFDEKGTINLVYNDSSPIGERWIASRTIEAGFAGLLMSMDDSGQMYYTSSDIGPGASGIITFSAKVLIK